MHFLRTVMNFVVAGALLGVLSVTILGPGYIQWDSSVPGDSADARCLCSERARYGADRIITYQMRGLAVGSGLGLAAGIAFHVIRRKRAREAAAGADASTTTAPPPAAKV